jgi:hypothetical protein
MYFHTGDSNAISNNRCAKPLRGGARLKVVVAVVDEDAISSCTSLEVDDPYLKVTDDDGNGAIEYTSIRLLPK